MNTDHDQFQDAIPAYVLGALEGAELEALEAHLATECEACNAELLRASRDLEALAAANEPVAPAETTRARVLGAIEDNAADEEREQPERSLAAWLPMAATIALVALGWSSWSQLQMRRELSTLQAQVATDNAKLEVVRKDLKRARRQLSRVAEANRILASPGLATVRLAGLEAAPEATAQALVADDVGGAVLYVSNLERVDKEHIYQLWVIVGGKPIGVGLFNVDKKGNASVILDELEAEAPIEAWAVTIEPAGGVPQPTGPMVLMGAVT